MVSLRPIFESETRNPHLATIKADVSSIAHSLYATETRLLEEKLRLYQQALKTMNVTRCSTI